MMIDRRPSHKLSTKQLTPNLKLLQRDTNNLGMRMHGFRFVAQVAPYCDRQVGGWLGSFPRASGGGVGGCDARSYRIGILCIFIILTRKSRTLHA